MMRLVRLALLVVVVAVARILWVAATPAPPLGPGDSKPVPQDHEKMRKQFEERLAWNRKTLGEAYEKVGKRSPKWDEAALKALDVAARVFSQQYEPLVQIGDAYGPAKQAVEAGCDDPMVLYLYTGLATGKGDLRPEESRRRMEEVAKALEECGYSPLRTAVALLRAAAWKTTDSATEQEKAEAQKQIDRALELLKGTAEEQFSGQMERYRYNVLNLSLSLQRQLEPDALKALQRIEKQVEGAEGLKAVWLALRGDFFFGWGWEARGKGFANAVTRQQFRTFDERLAEARRALEEAWRLKPGIYQVAANMLSLEKSVGDGDRAEMEKWFERAMESDGDDYGACWSKMDWLDPKWHGDGYEDMVAFGRACGATKNWHTGIILLGADAHLRYADRLVPQQPAKYLGRPDVWPEIESAYEVYLKHYPSNHSRRSKYAVLCAMSGHFRKSHAQFEILGENLTTWSHFPNVPLESLKQYRAKVAKLVGAKPPAP